jgi:hypothetical protein
MGGFRNRIINGDMRIAQRGTSNVWSGFSVLEYIPNVDRWKVGGSVTGVLTMYQNTLAVVDAPYQQGLRYASNIVVNSAGTSSGWSFFQVIEGYNFADANWGTPFGVPITLSFWVKSSIAGPFTFHILSGGVDYSYLTPYTIYNTNTWEYKTLTIAPPPNGSTFTTTTGSWASIQFRFAGGSSPATAGWIAGIYQKFAGTVNLHDVQGATWTVTGVQVEKGTVATPFEFRNYAQELALCQRYYEQSYAAGTVAGTNTNLGQNTFQGASDNNANMVGWVKYSVPKRVAPVPVIYRPGGTINQMSYSKSGNIATSNAATVAYNNEFSFIAYCNIGTLFTIATIDFHWTASAEL